MYFELFVVVALFALVWRVWVLTDRLWVLESKAYEWAIKSITVSNTVLETMNTRFRMAGEVANIQQAARVYQLRQDQEPR